MSSPRVSVVLCVRDDRGGLRATIDSVLAQADADLELVVVDDGSTDRTPGLLLELAAAEPRLRVVTHQVNRGLTPSINHGLDVSSAEWIARIDEGDTWAAGKLQAQLELASADPGLVLIGTQCTYRDPVDGAALLQPALPVSDRAMREAFLRGLNPVISSSALFKRSLGLRYNEGQGLPAGVSDPISDYEHWLRLSFLGRLANVDRSLVDFAYGPGYDGITSRRAGAQFELKRRIHARFVEVLARSDRQAARVAVEQGFSLGSELPGRAGVRRGASMRLRYAASYRGQPWRGLLRAAGYLLDPADLAFHAWSKAWLPLRLRGIDWAGWVDAAEVGGGQP